jgi:2-polyprenyl-3-methyl-5-hydroxy-6-metoxy-1,4-benzoquinol methylase
MEHRGDSSYVIRTGIDALDRLDLLARLFWPTTEALLTRTGAFAAGRFLDVGCGIGDVASRVAARGVGAVTGIDVNAAVVSAAVERAAGDSSPVVFRTGAITELRADALRAPFDVVFARCVVSHLPDPADALGAMLAALTPGGSILVEDVEVAAVWSSPRCDALARHAQLYVDAAFGLGARPDVGPELAGVLVALGATDVEVDVAQPVLRGPADLQIHARTMEAIAGPVVAQGLATSDEITGLVAQLDEFAATPGVVATLPRIVQVNARAPRTR